MSSVIKKIGTLRLNKGVDVSNVIHFGAPSFVRIAETESNKNFNAYELYVEDDSKSKPEKKQTTSESK